MSPSDLYILAFLIAVPLIFLVFLGMLWAMARRSRSWMGEYWAAQNGWHGGFAPHLPPEHERVAEGRADHGTLRGDVLFDIK